MRRRCIHGRRPSLYEHRTDYRAQVGQREIPSKIATFYSANMAGRVQPDQHAGYQEERETCF